MFTGPAGSRALLAKNYTNGYICKPSAGYGALQKKVPFNGQLHFGFSGKTHKTQIYWGCTGTHAKTQRFIAASSFLTGFLLL